LSAASQSTSRIKSSFGAEGWNYFGSKQKQRNRLHTSTTGYGKYYPTSSFCGGTEQVQESIYGCGGDYERRYKDVLQVDSGFTGLKGMVMEDGCGIGVTKGASFFGSSVYYYGSHCVGYAQGILWITKQGLTLVNRCNAFVLSS
jgi:hypothetical protein